MNPGWLKTMSRAAGVFGALLLFVAGTNYCLLSGWSGWPGMPCADMAPAQTGTSAASHCSHHPSPARGPGSPCSAASSPCCVQLAPAKAPVIEKGGATGTPAPAVHMSRIESGAPPASIPSWVGCRATHCSRPSSAAPRAPSAPRAPPLA